MEVGISIFKPFDKKVILVEKEKKNGRKEQFIFLLLKQYISLCHNRLIFQPTFVPDLTRLAINTTNAKTFIFTPVGSSGFQFLSIRRSRPLQSYQITANIILLP